MNGWQVCTLGDVLTLQRGHDLSSSQRTEGSIPVISSSGITGFHNVAKATPPGVVTGRYGTIGEVFYVNEPYWPLNTALYVVDFKGNNPRFVSYFLRDVLRNYKSEAAAVPGVNRNVIHRLKVKIPDNIAQQRIASVLSAYDDLIENNRRRIQLLEESARLLYKEWFVHLRFPGHESVKVVDGVPKGWNTEALVNKARITMGQSPKSEFYNEQGDGLPFHQGVTNYGDRFVTHKIFSTKETRLAQSGDILCSVRAPVGRLNYTLDNIILGRGLCSIASLTGNQSFLYYQFRNYFFKEDIIGSGAIYASVTKKDMQNIELISPPSVLVQEFEEITIPFDKQIQNLSEQTQKLTEARDLLLPRLMNGEIEV